MAIIVVGMAGNANAGLINTLVELGFDDCVMTVEEVSADQDAITVVSQPFIEPMEYWPDEGMISPQSPKSLQLSEAYVCNTPPGATKNRTTPKHARKARDGLSNSGQGSGAGNDKVFTDSDPPPLNF